MAAFKFIILIGFTCICIVVQGQTKQEVFAKTDTLKSVLLRADTLNPFKETEENIFDTIDAVNKEIANRLADLLTMRMTLILDPDSLFNLPFLGSVHSSDKRLWIFNWYENTGGSWKSNISLVHYRTEANKGKVDNVFFSVGKEPSEETNRNVFCSNGAWFEKIYKLRAKDKDLYLCIGSGISCNTCIYQIATVVELTKDSINFTYPAFGFDIEDVHSPGSGNLSCFVLDARMGNIEKFNFNPKTQTLSFAYLTDDHTPIQSKEQKRIVGHWVYDGEKFVIKNK